MNFLRQFLLNLFFGPVMFFASGAAPIGGGGEGGGGGAGGGTEGGGGDGSGPIATWGPAKHEGGEGAGDHEGDGGTDDPLHTEGDGGTDDFGDEDFSSSETDESLEESEGGEKTFKQFVDAIRNELTSQDPKAVKQAEKKLKRLYGENREYKAAGFESPEQARELTEKLESLGGIEGIETETAEAATMWNMLGAGDPAILETLGKDHGEGLVKLFPHFVDMISQKDPAGYAHKFANVFMATLNESKAGKLSVLAAINQLMKIEGVKESAEFQRIAEVINKIDEIANAAPQRKEGDGKLSQKERELNERETRMTRNVMAGKAQPILDSHARNAVKKLLGDRKLNKEATDQVVAWAHDEFARLMEKDKDAKKARQSLVAAGETDRWLKLVKSAAARTMPIAAKFALKKYKGISGLSSTESRQRREEGSSRREAGGGGQSGGTIRTNKAPDAKTVDWARMKFEAKKQGFSDSDEMFMFGRKFYRKGDSRNLYTY